MSPHKARAKDVLPELQSPELRCCCQSPLEFNGVLYTVIDAGCKVHGIKSQYVERLGETTERRRDHKKHTAHRNRD